MIDLSHSFGPGTPLYDGFPPTRFIGIPELRALGVQSHYYSFPGQCGTHIDPPGHLVDGLTTLDEIPPGDLIAPLAVVDLHREATDDPDLELRVDHLERWESTHGRIPGGAFVAARTDWSKRWPDDAALQGRDARGVTHWPGWSVDAVRFLAEDRDVVAIGHETLGTDGGVRTSQGRFDAQRLWHSHGKYQVEMLKDLDLVPPCGAVVFCGAPKPIRGSGFPVRVLAVLLA